MKRDLFHPQPIEHPLKGKRCCAGQSRAIPDVDDPAGTIGTFLEELRCGVEAADNVGGAERSSAFQAGHRFGCLGRLGCRKTVGERFAGDVDCHETNAVVG